MKLLYKLLIYNDFFVFFARKTFYFKIIHSFVKHVSEHQGVSSFDMLTFDTLTCLCVFSLSALFHPTYF